MYQQPDSIRDTLHDIIALHSESRALQIMLVWSCVSVLALFPPALLVSLLVFFVLFAIGANALINTVRRESIIIRANLIWRALS